MSGSGLRFPAALQCFPLLRRFPAIRPRRLAAVPIGNRGPIEDAHIQACVRHMYHDLGVIAYAGCTEEQISRVGDLLSKVVNSGGPGALVTMLEWTGKTERRRLEPLDENDVFEAFDIAHAGIIKPKVLFQVADAAFRAHITNRITGTTRLDPSKLQLRERHVQIRGIPSPKGIVHQPISGERLLPVDAFTNISVDRKHGAIRGDMQLFSAGGKGEYVGACQISYTLYHVDREQRTMKSLWPHRELPPENEDDYLRTHAKRLIRSDILRELWDLESEVYGEKADRLVRYDKVGLAEWAEEGRRPSAKGGRGVDFMPEDMLGGQEGEAAAEAREEVDGEASFEHKFKSQRRSTGY